MKKKIMSVLVAAMMVAATAVPAFAADTVKIGVYEPASGDNGAGGKQETLGVQYANSVTPTVEIDGKEYDVELDIVDNESSNDKGPSAAAQLVSDKVSIVLGSYGSGVSIAASDIFKDGGVPALGISCTNPQITQGNTHYFRICFLDPFQGTVMANYAIQNGYQKAAVITQLGDDYSSGLGSFFKSAFEKLGGTIVAEEQFQTNQSDFKAILTNIKSANPDIIFAPSSITTAPLIIKQAREMGITAVIAAGDTWENATIIENAGADAEGTVFSTFYDEAAPANDEAAAFVDGFKAYLTGIGESDIIPAVSALGYDAYITAVQAIKDADSVDPAAIKDALKNVHVEGVTGDITFDENGDANKDMAYIKTIKDGQIVFLTTTSIDE